MHVQFPCGSLKLQCFQGSLVLHVDCPGLHVTLSVSSIPQALTHGNLLSQLLAGTACFATSNHRLYFPTARRTSLPYKNLVPLCISGPTFLENARYPSADRLGPISSTACMTRCLHSPFIFTGTHSINLFLLARYNGSCCFNQDRSCFCKEATLSGDWQTRGQSLRPCRARTRGRDTGAYLLQLKMLSINGPLEIYTPYSCRPSCCSKNAQSSFSSQGVTAHTLAASTCLDAYPMHVMAGQSSPLFRSSVYGEVSSNKPPPSFCSLFHVSSLNVSNTSFGSRLIAAPHDSHHQLALPLHDYSPA
jgi:hypothetical protein